MDDVARTQRALEQLDRLRASRNGHAALATAAGVDLSRPAYALLRRIDEHGPAPLGELAWATGMDAASTGRQVRRLEELGLRRPRAERCRRVCRGGRDHRRRRRRATGASPTCSTDISATCSTAGRGPTGRSWARSCNDSSTISVRSNSATRHFRPAPREEHDMTMPTDVKAIDLMMGFPKVDAVKTYEYLRETTRGDDASTAEFPGRLHVQGRAEPPRRGAGRRRGHGRRDGPAAASPSA